MGLEIDKWQGSKKIHCYYPKVLNPTTKQLEISIPIPEGSVRENITIANNKLKIALNANGVYINGTKLNDISGSQHFSGLVAQKTAKIGSVQGSVRSKATYNRVGIYNRILSNEELITLTSIDA